MTSSLPSDRIRGRKLSHVNTEIMVRSRLTVSSPAGSCNFRFESWRNLDTPELAIQYGCLLYQQFFATTIKSNSIVQQLPIHVLFLCTHVQTVTYCVITSWCWLTMLTKTLGVANDLQLECWHL